MTSFKETSVAQESSQKVTTDSESLTGINQQNLLRLKINRIALVQDLRVEHVIGYLLNAGVIDGDNVTQINSGTSPQDKTRLLLNLLSTKSRKTHWYKHFRESLQNVEAGPETRRRYKILVSFLDNTTVQKPTSRVSSFSEARVPEAQELMLLPGNKEQTNQGKLPHYTTLPDIGQTDSLDNDNMKADNPQNKGDWMRNEERELSQHSNGYYNNMTLVQGQFYHWFPMPNNFRSVINIPKDYCQRLLHSEDPKDQELLAKEETALVNLRRVEVVATLAWQKLLPAGFELCLSDAVEDLLRQPKLYHMYLKHFVALEAAGIMLMKEICLSYEAALQTEESYSVSKVNSQIAPTGFKLANLLIAVNKYSDAGNILAKTMQLLQRGPVTDIESWMPRYHGFVSLMYAWNLACQPDKAEAACFQAVQMQYQITMMSFGQDVVQAGAWHAETSCMMLEHGSVASALGWSKRALQEVDSENPASVVRVLCVASNCYCAHWLVRKAELLAVYGVQYARIQVGETHPLFVEALYNFCHFSSEFRQVPVALQVARELLEAAEKTYGCESLQVALAHLSISKASMSLRLLDTDDYYTHAREALRLSETAVGHHSALLYNFLHTFASALLLKAEQCFKEDADSALREAEAVAKQALDLMTETFGEISTKVAQTFLLLGKIYSKMYKTDVAEKYFKQAVDYLKLCQPSTSFYLLQGINDLAGFYKNLHKYDLAIPLFQFVVDHIESTGWHIQWVHECFEDLVQLYSFLGQGGKAEAAQAKLSHWLKANPKTSKSIDYYSLKEEPVSFQIFVAKTDLWKTVVQRIADVPLGVETFSLIEDERK